MLAAQTPQRKIGYLQSLVESPIFWIDKKNLISQL